MSERRVPKRERDAPVLIFRSAYATDQLFRRAIEQAQAHGRRVIAIASSDGR